MRSFRPSEIFKYFFYLFLFTIPLQGRKVFLIDDSFYTGAFTEYLTPALYISDLLLIISFLLFSIFATQKLKNGLLELKIKSGTYTRSRSIWPIAFLLGWFIISSIFHPAHLYLGLYSSLRLFEMLLLVIFIILAFRDKIFLSSSLYSLIFAGIFQSSIAIHQFIFQHYLFSSPFLHKLTGETIIAQELPGVAKIYSESGTMIRAYGTLPHPNVLAGFLLFTIAISFILYLQHKSANMSSSGKKRLSSSFFWLVAFTLQLAALLFTFSRSAWLAFAISFIVFFVFQNSKSSMIVSRETISTTYHKFSELFLSIIVILIILSFNFPLINDRMRQDICNESSATLPSNDTFADRNFYSIVSRETISNNPIFGSGPSTSVFQIDRFFLSENITQPLEPWQYQPPHNIFLLIAAETGLVGCFLFLILIINVIRFAISVIVSRETIFSDKLFKKIMLSLFIGFLFIGLFDHYFLTLQQGRLVFWIVIALLLI